MIKEAIETYKQEVEAGKFPGPEHSFIMEARDLGKLRIKSKTSKK
jgi:hypothetical protein